MSIILLCADYALVQYWHKNGLQSLLFCASPLVEVPSDLDASSTGVGELVEHGGRQVNVARAAARAEIPDGRGSRLPLV